MVDNSFDPASVTANGEVRLVNEGEALHNLTVEGEGVDFDVQPGQTKTESLGLDPGSYTILCKYHAQQGMEGTLTIQ
jgi:plastocyanin